MGSSGVSHSRPDPIAIIGLSCKFGGDAKSPESFWKLLEDAKSAWEEIPSSRFSINGSYHPDPDRLGTVRGFFNAGNGGLGRLIVGIDTCRRCAFYQRGYKRLRRSVFQFIGRYCSGKADTWSGTTEMTRTTHTEATGT